MNKQYLKENGLYEAHKQFMRLCEWSYSPSALEEDDAQQDPNADPNAMGADPNAMGGADSSMGGDPMGGTDPSMGADPNADPNAMGGDPNADPSMGSDPNAMGTDPNAMGGDMMDDPNAMGGDPMGGDMMDDPNAMGDDNEVIDVEDLTQAQEKVNDKVNHIGKNLGSVDDRINSLMKALDKMEAMINKNNAKIEDLNNEFQKRIKTPTEKLNLRSLDSYPFNVKPTEYWDKAVKDMPQYSVTDDNEIPTQKEYTIHQSDIDSMSDKEIEDSFDSVIDDNMRQDINKIFGL